MKSRALIVAEDSLQKVAERYLRFFHSVESQPQKPGGESLIICEEPSRYNSFAVPEKSVDSRFKLEKYTSVFFWGLYDLILLQDQFVRRHEEVCEISRSPLAVAHHLFYNRGQFASIRSRIQPIFTNPLGFRSAASGHAGRDSPDRNAINHAQSLKEARLRARQCLDEGQLWEDLDLRRDHSLQLPKKRSLELGLEGFAQLSAEIRRQVEAKSLELWVVEDVKEVLEVPFNELGGIDFWEKVSKLTGAIWLLRTQPSNSTGPSIEALKDLEELAARINEELLKRKREMPVLVVDILFEKMQGRTGLDIISEVRRRAGEDLVLIAHTGYGSPLVTRACHHEGADFVVRKGGSYIGSHTSHTEKNEHGGERLNSWMEVFWNILSLQAAYRFGCHALRHLSGRIANPTAAWVSETRWLGQDWEDLKSIIQPYSEVHFKETWRGNVFDALCESAHLVTAIQGSGGLDPELRRWKREILAEVKRLNREVP